MSCHILLAAEIQASAASIYEAITTQKGEASFWTSDNDADPTVGSIASFGFPGAPVRARMRVDALETDRLVRWTCVGDFPYWEGTTVTWEMASTEEGKTNVTLDQGGWPDAHPDKEFASVAYVWAQVLARLKGYVESGVPQPFFG